MAGPSMLLLAFGAASSIATLVGGFLALRFAKHLHLVLGVSAGAVLSVAFLDLAPSAIAFGGKRFDAFTIMAVVVAGFLLYMVADRILLKPARDGPLRRGPFAPASLTAHSLLDGLAIGLGFQVSTAAGALIAVAVVAHDLADGLNTVTLSLRASGSRRTAWQWLLADAAAPIVGVMVGSFLHVQPATLAIIIATFTGFFIYIGASELVPESYDGHPRAWTSWATIAGALGIGIAVRFAER